MLSRTAIRASTSTSVVARRGFHATRARMSSPYHYPEGPRSNIPFNPLTRFFAFRYWAFMGMHRTNRGLGIG
jgi:cytochrome c oxidase subunit 7c